MVRVRKLRVSLFGIPSKATDALCMEFFLKLYVFSNDYNSHNVFRMIA